MKTNQEKFKSLVSKEKTNTAQKNKDRIKNRMRLRESQDIAMKVLDKLDELGWSQKRLADEMEVSPQQITKIVSGKANLTLESIVKIQTILEIPILVSHLEKQLNDFFEKLIGSFSEKYTPAETSAPADYTSSDKKEIKMSYDKETDDYSFESDYNLSA
ncbi:helix-turn-helix transcriptional regulator [Brumimicrobium sp.]|uniref:helix-turn-helix transcriptional regulator n=1 Tax=Brumimicrobium sp. TaxID=2029867 RepID=UPI003A933035